uniref:BTB domain-containing protein n=1 Tax=Meloidogyne floridensis TaxID=298350 RepID=A0A915NIN0_9BILA
MMAAAQQHRKKRSLAIRKTDAMNHAERQNGTVLDQIWMQGDPSSFLNLSTSENQTKSENNQNLGVIEEDENLNYLEKDPLIEKSDGDKISNIKIKQKTEEKENERISQQPSEFREEENSVVLRLNIGGVPFFVLVEALLHADPSTFLTKFRSPLAFEAVFQYYANGVVHKPPELCPSAFSAELEFWRVPTSYIGACCSDSVSPLERLLESSKEDKVDDTSFEKLRFGQFRRRMWTFLERPGSSMQAKVFELSSTMFVMISVLGLSFGTIPDFQVIEYVSSGNQTIMLPNGTEIIQEDIEPIRIEHPIFVFTERVCIAFFTIEYLLRLFAAPRKLRFVLKPLNLVDLLAIMPFYLELMLTLMGVDDKKLRDLRWAFLVVRILRVLRVIRIIKLGRFSSGLQTFGMTLQRSQKQLQMMTIVLLTGVVFFSTMIYFLEKDEKGSPFTSIPAAYWWCIVTMTTVGYGDVVPATTMGKIIASAAIMSGVLVLALPITIIVDNFIKVAQEEQQTEQFKAELLAMEEQERQLQQEQEQRRLKFNQSQKEILINNNNREENRGNNEDNQLISGKQPLIFVSNA